MAGPRDRQQPEQSWSLAEKNYLLAEIIKAAYPDPNDLFMVIVRKGIQPAWDDIPLPPGRSLNSCKSTYAQFQDPRVSYGYDPRTPLPTSGYQQATKRAYDGSFLGSREIRPKPSTGSTYSPTVMMDQPPRKKRGRPTKAEAQAKAEAHIAGPGPTPRSEGAAPSSVGPATRPAAESDSPIVAAPPDLSRPIPPMARVPISSMITPTGALEASQSSSSSGKRKRGRSTRSDPENYPFADESSARQAEGDASPYPRMGVEPADTPARAAVMRHREDPQPGIPPPEMPEQGAQPHPEPRIEPDTK